MWLDSASLRSCTRACACACMTFVSVRVTSLVVVSVASVAQRNECSTDVAHPLRPSRRDPRACFACLLVSRCSWSLRSRGRLLWAALLRVCFHAFLLDWLALRSARSGASFPLSPPLFRKPESFDEGAREAFDCSVVADSCGRLWLRSGVRCCASRPPMPTDSHSCADCCSIVPHRVPPVATSSARGAVHLWPRVRCMRHAPAPGRRSRVRVRPLHGRRGMRMLCGRSASRRPRLPVGGRQGIRCSPRLIDDGGSSR